MPLSDLIDVHCHSITPAYHELLTTKGGYRVHDWSPELALAYMDRRGIAAGVYSLSFPGVHFGDDAEARVLARRCNEEAVAFVSKWPDRFGAFATLTLPDVDGACKEAAYALDEMKLDGIGLLASYGGAYLGQPEFDPLMEVLNERSATVHVHPTAPPSGAIARAGMTPFVEDAQVEFLFDTTRAAVNLVFTRALERFPNIKFILSHAGGTLPYASWRLSEIIGRMPRDPKRYFPFMTEHAHELTPALVMEQFGRFWYDTALSAGRQTFGTLRHVARPDRILFGSDWPYCTEDMAQDMIETLSEDGFLSAQESEAIARRNALALFPRLARVAV